MKSMIEQPYLLTLYHNEERTAQGIRMVMESGFHDVIVYDGVDGKRFGLATYRSSSMTPGQIGCLLSHMAIWEAARTTYAEKVLVFEDDILLPTNAHDRMKRSLVNLPDDWQLVYWGYLWNKTNGMEKVNSDFSRIKELPMGTHAYTINAPLLDSIGSRLHCKLPLDQQLALLLHDQPGVYLFNDPTFARQRSMTYVEEFAARNGAVPVKTGVFASTCAFG